MNETDIIHPLKDVWLRPRAVFRELARQPLSATDYVLAALQGVSSYLLALHLQTEIKLTGTQMLSNALLYGSATGLLVTWFYSALYARLGARFGRTPGRKPIYHILAYGGVPVVAALVLSVGSAILIGDAVFIDKPAAELDSFVLVITRLQMVLAVLLYLWSYLLQVMGFSELFAVPVRRALGLWVLGQIVGALAAIFLRLLLMILFPAIVPAQ